MALISPLGRIAALAGFALFATGCLNWGGSKFKVPAELIESGAGARLGASATQQEAYDQLFRPPLAKIHFKAGLIARGSALQGKRKLEILFVAPDLELLRMRGLYHNNTAFDLVVNKGVMSVLLPQSGEAFSGPIPPQGSPFMEHYGIEPTDLPLIFRVGEIIAFGDFQREESPDIVTLRPPVPPAGPGLVAIELDPASGLPRNAIWQAQQGRWTVQYLAWNYFTDVDVPAARRLLPARVRIEREKPASTLDLEVESYHLDSTINPELFTTGTMGYQATQHPLSALSAALE